MRYPSNSRFQNIYELAPSVSLFNDARLMMFNRTFDEEYFANVYTPAYYKEIEESEAAQQRINDLIELSKTNDILLLCSCATSKCHRILLGNILERRGCKVLIQ